MTIAAPESDRIPALDGVRGLAILFVLVMHSLYIGPHFGLDVMNHPYARVAWLGWSGVDVFFVLSGFLITGILVRSKGGSRYFRNFYIRRALRIFPLYYLVIVLLLYVLERKPVSVGGQLAHLLYYQNFYYVLAPGASFDAARHVTWSLAIEEQFYLLWPAVVLLTSVRMLRIVCVVTIIAAVALRLSLVDAGFHGTHFLTPCRLDALAWGALFAVMPRPSVWLGRIATPVGIAGLIATGFVSGSSLPDTPAQQTWGLLAALALGVGLLTLARTEPRLARVFNAWPLRTLGKYSYCIYLTHMLVVEWLTVRVLTIDPETLLSVRQVLPPVGMTIVFTVGVVVCSWALALCSWHLFERWFLALKRYFPSGG